MSEATVRRVVLEIDLSELCKALREDELESYRTETNALARKADELFPDGIELTMDGGEMKSTAGTLLATRINQVASSSATGRCC